MQICVYVVCNTEPYTYDAWGNILSITDNIGNDVSANAKNIGTINPLRYRGYYYDSETGLYYLKSRFYDPTTGRFVNADGLVTAGNSLLSTNMFAYCENNPVNFVDFNGKEPTSILEIWMVGMPWLCGIDGLLPVGDFIYGAGIVLIAVVTFPNPFKLTINNSPKNIEKLRKSLSETEDSEKKPKVEEPEVEPDIKYPGDDGNKPPSKDYKWKGRLPKGGDKGSWVNDKTGEQLHPDLRHEKPIGPHWDYKDPIGKKWRIFPNNTIKPK